MDHKQLIKEALTKLKINVLQAAYQIDVSPRYLYRVVHGQKAIGPKLAEKINKWLKENG